MDILSSTLAAGGSTAASSGAVIPPWFMITSGIIIVAILIFDVLLVFKRPHVPSMREATLWVVFYVSLALIFGASLFWIGDAQHGSEFLTGWLLEYSLSVDNLFVFIIIMGSFQVPRKYQQEVLMVGIIIAIIFRGLFILAGAAIISAFVEVFFIFGIFLLFVAYRQAFSSEDEGDGENFLIRFLRKRMNIIDEYHGNKLRVDIDGTKYWTPMFIVFLAIGSTDVMFALDSIPAIFGVTQVPFLVFTANVFASWVCVSSTSSSAGSSTNSSTSTTASRDPRVHRRQALHHRPPRDRHLMAAVGQGRARGADLAVADVHRRGHGRGDDRLAHQDEAGRKSFRDQGPQESEAPQGTEK